MRFIARYAKDLGDSFELITLYDERQDSEILNKENPIIKTIARKHPSAIWFERKISDDFGIIFEDSFDKRSLVHQERFPKNIHPMRKDFKENDIEFSDYIPYKYEEISGDSVYQVAVGPIHAGIIEPGHFQFSQAGEGMLHLEVRHFYKYRAIEKMLEAKTLYEAKPIIERISANESVAYQIAFRDILLEASSTPLPKSTQKYHAFLLELERIIHHLTDLGFIPNDAGFGAGLAICSKLSEDARRKLKEISGHRFGFGAVDFEGDFKDKESLHLWLNQLSEDIKFFEDWIVDIPSVWDRFDTTGVLTLKKAIKYDSVGLVARACGISVDRRLNEFYLSHGFKMQSELSGDVAGRFKLRIKEVKNSILMMHNFLDDKYDKDEDINLGEIKDGSYSSFVESSIGELFMAIDIKDGLIDRFYVRDPSFMNWQVIHTVMPENIIADFPLINKSFDLSYAGNDL